MKWLGVGWILMIGALAWQWFTAKPTASHVLFSNDGPLGAVVNAQARYPAAATSIWADSNWLGGPALVPGPAPSKSCQASPWALALPIITAGLFCLLSDSAFRWVLRISMAGFAIGLAIAFFVGGRLLEVLAPAAGMTFLCGLLGALWLEDQA